MRWMCTLPPPPVNCNLSCNCTWQVGTIKPVVRSWLRRIVTGKRGNHFCMEKLKGKSDIWEQNENKKSLRKHQMFFSLETLILFYPKEPWTWKSQAAIPVWSRDCQQRVEELQYETQGDPQKGNKDQGGGASSLTLWLGVQIELWRFLDRASEGSHQELPRCMGDSDECSLLRGNC